MSTDPYHASALSWQVVALTNQLERSRDELRAEVELRLDQIDGWKERLRASEAENERLRALIQAHHSSSVSRVPPGGLCPVCQS